MKLYWRGFQAFQHGIMQTSRNSVGWIFLIIKTFGWGIWECAKEDGRCYIQCCGKIFHVYIGGHDNRYCICGEYGELIHIEA